MAWYYRHCNSVAFWMITAMMIALLALFQVKEYMEEGSRRWFKEELNDDNVVSGWNESERDSRLHTLSKWGQFNSGQFQAFVSHQVQGLRIANDSTFFFLEIGVGVGAFARKILQMFPHSNGVGIDIEPGAIAIASRVLPTNRMALSVGNMISDLSNFPHDYFDNIFVPGSICYLHSIQEVTAVMSEASRILKVNGGICLSMIASDVSETGSCYLRIPKAYFTHECREHFRVVQIDEMDSWELGHSNGRYSICLRKR